VLQLNELKKGNILMEITTKLVKDLANLSRLSFTEQEFEAFKQEFAKTMEHVDTLAKIDTSKVKSTSNTISASADLRLDEVKTGLTQTEALQEAPKHKQGMFAVDKIID
jgi:aspartyl-tRNA(Asn)/glutamyl-tRNA(Gln) amidotransferase subunit C